MSLKERVAYDWKSVQSFGRIVPPMRVNSAVTVNNNAAYCIGGKGVGQSNAMWKFHLDTSEWEELEPTGEAPKERDSHTLTSIGNNKLLLFGGQGRKTNNDRKLRQTKLQTYKVFQSKELFNDTHIFDTAENAWHRILCKSQVPFSRRGHTATYIPPMHFAHKHAVSPGIEDGSLVVYGGSGMDTFTGIEVAFNDVWVYTPEKELWSMIATKGIPPIPSFLHAATLQGDFLVIMGGITDPNPPTAIPTGKEKGNQGIKSLTQGIEYAKPISGIMLLNIRTLCWSHLEVTSPETNQLAGVFNYGHAAVSDPTNPDNIFVFGGRDTADGVADKKNSGRKQYTGNQRRTGVVARTCSAWVLDIRKCTITRIVTLAKAPSNRYGHFCFSVLPSDYRALFFDHHKDKKSGFMSSDSIKTNEKVMYIFGGCGIDDSGYCVPDMHHLVRSISYLDVNDANKTYFDEVSAMNVPFTSESAGERDLDIKPKGSNIACNRNHGSKHSSFVVDMNTTGDIFELSMWEKVQQMKIMVHNANELKKMHEANAQARRDAGLLNGVGSSDQSPAHSICDSPTQLDSNMSNNSSPRSVNRSPQTCQSPKNGGSPSDKDDGGTLEHNLMMSVSNTFIAPVEKKMPSNYDELKMSLSFSLSDINGSDRGVGIERYGFSATPSHSRPSTAFGSTSASGRPGSSSGIISRSSPHHHSSGVRSGTKIGFSDSCSISHAPDGNTIRPQSSHGRLGASMAQGEGMHSHSNISQGSQESYLLGSPMSIASMQRPQTAPGIGKKQREHRKPVVDTIPRPEVVAARMAAIRSEKIEVRKNARVIKKEMLPNLSGKSLKQARDDYLTNNCPPVLFPHYHPELTRTIRAESKKHHHYQLTQAGTQNPVNPFFISSAKSQSMRATASTTAHHHGSKTDNFVRDL